MTTVDDAVEAGARALYQLEPTKIEHEYRVDAKDWVPHCVCGWRASESFATGEYDEHVSRIVLEQAWPVLSAGLRRMHAASTAADYAGDCMCGLRYPCPTVQELDRIDKELGNGS